MNLFVVFLTGLTIGGLTCLAVQGGLLASVIAARENEKVNLKKTDKKNNNFYPTLAFLSAKLIAHTIVGFLLGAFGNIAGVNQTAQIIIQLIAGLYMLAIALNLLNVHPIFRYAVLQPPKFLTRRIKNQSRSKDLFAPSMLGLMSVFIPCGTTLAMEAMAVATGSPFMGAAVIATFVLGTMPLFFGLGWLTTTLGDNFKEKFLKVAAVLVIYLGLVSIDGALIALDVPINSKTVVEKLNIGNLKKLYSELPPTQDITIAVNAGGYSPNYVKVKKGQAVTLKLVGKNAYSCASAFRIPSLGISKNLGPNETYEIKFAPENTGKIRFACSMGMYTGIIEVI